MAFRFRQFEVEDEKSTLRIGTDAMLLGSWANPGKAKKILDIGTGCGVLALMMAQKSDATIETIDIDQSSVLEARNNFSKSPWDSRISAIHDSLQLFSGSSNADYGFIITNPPYFSSSLKSPFARTNKTRHDDSLSLNELALIVNRLLAPVGCFALILPSETANQFQLICARDGLYLSRMLVVYPKPDINAKRTLMEFIKTKVTHPDKSELTILDRMGAFTPEYLALTACFHNF